ncbi:MAG TPA: potassium-transporting ATPase subunit KdpA [Gemmatimonadaceae bacterium]|jgi:K+-transporting ATPase ATPase A chain|nr:potassium-transporting ATPase subunit KdpA [Gemmatimonadaceae bacterium]
MTAANLAQYLVFLAIVAGLVKPLGVYMAHVFSDEPVWLDGLLKPVERAIYRTIRINPDADMPWHEYATAFVVLGSVGTLLLYAMLRAQRVLPGFDPHVLTTPVTPDLAFNTAISFATTTTWQAYAGETTMSYVTQMVGLVTQNFIAGAAGLAVGIAFIRGIARNASNTLGNFWVDVVRAVLYVLLPLSLLTAIVLVWQGVPMNWSSYTHATTLGGVVQTIAQGPVVALETIKNLGTNGGGFFNANGAHPYENPTPFTNLLELLSITVLPAALTYTFGRLTRRPRDGWLLFGVMTALFTVGLAVAQVAEQRGTPAVAPNMEGKEVRFGVAGSVLGAVTTSNGATGSYNAMHDSFTPIGGAVPLVNMLLGETIYGGLGTGLISLVMVGLLGLFLTGLMIGRSPEYFGKGIGPPEMTMLMLYTIVAPVTILGLVAIAVITPAGLAGLTTNTGVHGFTEIVVAYASAFANNGQSFAGLNANTPFYNITLAIAMLLGRFGLVIPALALAGRLSRITARDRLPGTFPTDSLLFGGVVVGTLLIVGALTFLPTLTLGPLTEQLAMLRHR